MYWVASAVAYERSQQGVFYERSQQGVLNELLQSSVCELPPHLGLLELNFLGSSRNPNCLAPDLAFLRLEAGMACST